MPNGYMADLDIPSDEYAKLINTWNPKESESR